MKTILSLFLCVFLSFGLVGCVSIENVSEETALTAANMDAQTRNLQKTAKVWGFAKYHHMAFLTGERCWDTELLALIPLVRFANEEDVNDILYDWFTGLGDPGWDGLDSMFIQLRIDDPMITPFFAPIPMPLTSLFLLDEITNKIMNEIDWLDLIRYCSINSYFIVRTSKTKWPDLQTMTEGLGFFYPITVMDMVDINFRQIADMSWINESYLGVSLYAALSQFLELPVIERTNAPVCFNNGGNPFTNQNPHEKMDFGDYRYRLLGLFRLWNTMKYYFPYLDILDDCWNDLILEHIPKMLEETDRLSYELTLAALASRLHDGHIVFINGFESWRMFDDKFGAATAPVRLTEAEGHLVVADRVARGRLNYEQQLMPGDVILRVNGVDINEIIAKMLRFVPFPNDEKALFYLARFHTILRQKSTTVQMELDVLRDGVELKVYENTIEFIFPPAPPMPQRAHELLENSIGLINPSALPGLGIRSIMEYFADTDGLIIDLRQRPGPGSSSSVFELAEYLVEKYQLFAIMSFPSQFAPGVFADLFRPYSGGVSGHFGNVFLYENPVVILMDGGTISYPETVIMSLRNGANVTVMGSSSTGANGNIAHLPLPGGLTMRFSSIGVYTAEGGQTQRIGLSPDIYVHRTIAGIREGRDELMEAAIEFIFGQR